MSEWLAAQQQALVRALAVPRLDDAMNLIAAHARQVRACGTFDLKRGLQAYRSHAHELAPRALAGVYPAVAHLLGADNFDALARMLWREHAPPRGDLAQWGGELAACMARLPDLAAHQPWLPDVARVEWALHGAAGAADVPPDAASLGLLATGDPQHHVLVLAPGVCCVASDWPVVSLALAPHAQPAGPGETARIWRHGFAPRVACAAAGEAAFLAAVQAGESVLDAVTAAPGFDFAAWLPLAVPCGLLLGVRPRP